METSLVLYFNPEVVRPYDEAGMGQEKSRITGIREGWVWSERKWSTATVDTGVGNPKKATAEKGEKFFKDVTKKIAELIEDVSDTNINDLYENSNF